MRSPAKQESDITNRWVALDIGQQFPQLRVRQPVLLLEDLLWRTPPARATTDPVYDIRLAPSNHLGYSDRNLSGRIYDDTAAKIANNCRIEFAFLNEAGGQWWSENDYQAGSGYAAISKTYGSNCFVVVDVKDEFETLSSSST